MRDKVPSSSVCVRAAQLNRQVLEVSNQFPTEEFAYLSVELPKTKCKMFSAWVKSPVMKPDTMIVGRRKPFLNFKKDRERIQAYEHSFAQLQAGFAVNSSVKRGRTR